MRDYVQERKDYYGYGKASEVTAKQRRHRKEMAGRQKARRLLKVKKWDPREVHHKNHNATDNRKSNLQVISQKKNRSDNQRQGK